MADIMGEETDNDSDFEAIARKLAIDDEHMQEMKEHSYYKYEAPEQCSFVSEADEIAYYDSLSEEHFLSEEESQKTMAAWRNVL